MKNVLLTGAPGVGKTTVIKKAVRRLGERADGFFTEELEAGGRVQSLRAVSLAGQDAIVARREAEGPVRVGEYAVDLAALDEVAATAVRRAVARKRIVVIDGIDLLALASAALRAAIFEALDAPQPLLGVISREEHPDLEAIRGRPDTLVLEVTRANRDQLLDRIWFGLRLPTESFAETQRNIAKKRAKAIRYARENRLRIHALSGRFRSDHHEYRVSYEAGQWHCECSFFLKYGTCSHTMASQEIMRDALAAPPGASGAQP